MRNAMIPLARLLDTVQRRFQRSRAGSVMILVVTLLVLMAIIGTAFLTTARNDRYSSQLHESNVQVDMLLDGVKNIVLGRMAAENFLDPNGQRWDDVHSDNWLASRTPAYMIDACGVWDPNRTYDRGDWVSVISSTSPLSATFYVSRVKNNFKVPPTGDPNSVTNWMQDPTARPDSPCWEAVSSLFDLTPGLGVTAEDVRGVVNNNPAVFDGVRGRNLIRLTSVLSNGQYYPAFYFYRAGDQSANPPVADGFQTVVAASASGNGIPDSFLWRLPMGEINGVTYYAAARVIDNNAAINLNTAGSNLYDFDASGNLMPNLSIFPGDVGLAELLSTFNLTANSDSTMGSEFTSLNLYRNASGNLRPDGILQMNAASPTGGASKGTSVPEADFLGNWEFRPEFQYLSVADAQYMGLGRRIDYPGISTVKSSTPIKFNTLSWSDSAALGYRFDLVNPITPQLLSGFGGASTIEKILPTTLWNQPYYTTQAWDPSNSNYPLNWFNANYVYQNLSNGQINPAFNRRPMFVARNPQSNLMPLHVPEMDALRNWYFQAASAMGYTSDTSVTTRGNLPRVSLNTADPILGAPNQNALQAFVSDGINLYAGAHQPTLWLGFYNAMLGALEEPYTDNTFRALPAYVQQPDVNLIYKDTSGNVLRLAQQFRSSLRDPTGLGPFPPNRGPLVTVAEPQAKTFLPPSSQLLLRSLIAAVNAADLRDNDDDVTSATIFGFPVVVNGAYMQTRLTVFGAERQPFITEIYVNNDTSTQSATLTGGAANDVTGGKTNANGYVAVELYNPYDEPISLNGWALASLHRAVPGAAPNAGVYYYPSYAGATKAMAPKLIGAAPGPTFPVPGDANLAIIPPRSFLVLENVNPSVNINEYRPWWIYPTSPTTNTAAGAQLDRQNTTLYYYVPGLEQVLKDPANTESSGDELYLLRPRQANGVAVPKAFTTFYDEDPAGNPYAAKAYSYLTDMVPVDSFDFCGINKTDTFTFQAWHYVRANTLYQDTYTPARPSWKFVYRGHWDATPSAAVTAAGCHEDGVATSGLWDAPGHNNTGTPQDPWITTPPTSVNGPLDGMATAPIAIGSPDYASSYQNPYPGIPINNTGYGVAPNQATQSPVVPTAPFENGLNKNLNVTSGSSQFNAYPFGGFARNGDVLQVPFIGSYTITVPIGDDTYVIEMNPITADAGFADGNCYTYMRNSANPPSAVNPAMIGNQYPLILPVQRSNGGPPVVNIPSEASEEQIGRFAPLSSVDAMPANFWNNGQIPSDTDPSGHFFDTYGWCSQVMDFMSAAQTPNDDWLPHSKPEYYYLYDLTANRYIVPPNADLPKPVANSSSTVSSPDGVAEQSAPIEGLINVNTASWRVLAELPFNTILPSAGSANAMLTRDVLIAQAIVRYRNTHGPFHSLFDLNRVIDPFQYYMNPGSYNSGVGAEFGPLFQSANGTPDGADYLSFQGVFTPNFPGFLNDPSADPARHPGGVMTDYSHRMAEVMKLSNLLTTRSDSFTVYLQVQGWRGAGTPGAQLVVQRRAAFIMDRSGSSRSVDPKSNTTNVISVNVPTKIQTE